MSDEQKSAVDEFQHAARALVESPSNGTRYALEMAAAEVQLVGLDPGKITPDGYESLP